MDSCFVEVLGLRLENQDEGGLLRPEKEAVLDVGRRSWGPFLQGRGRPRPQGQGVLSRPDGTERSCFNTHSAKKLVFFSATVRVSTRVSVSLNSGGAPAWAPPQNI